MQQPVTALLLPSNRPRKHQQPTLNETGYTTPSVIPNFLLRRNVVLRLAAYSAAPLTIASSASKCLQVVFEGYCTLLTKGNQLEQLDVQ